MARTDLTVLQVIQAGLNPAYTAANSVANGGNMFPNTGDAFLHVKNGSGSSINVTVDIPGLVAGMAISDLVVAVPAGGERMIGPFDPTWCNQSDGKVYVDFSAVTTVTVAAIKLR